MKRKKEVYLKAYLNKNLGDDLFIKMISERYENTNFITFSVAKYDESYVNVKMFNNKYINKLISKITLGRWTYENILMNRCDYTILIGGSMFMENKYYKPKRHYFNKKQKYYILGSNFGPYNTQEYYNKFYNIFSKAEDVCFREEYSYRLFEKLPNIRFAPDIVFSLDTSNIKINNSKKVIISVINCDAKTKSEDKKKYEEKIIDLIGFFNQKEYKVVLMSYCKAEGDEDAINSILNKITDEKLKNEIDLYFYNGNLEDALNVMGDCQIVIGSRFHANILGLILNKTIIPIVYSDKTLNVLNDIKFEGKIIDIRKLEEFNINELNENDLNYKLDVSEQMMKAQKHFEKLDNKKGKFNETINKHNNSNI